MGSGDRARPFGEFVSDSVLLEVDEFCDRYARSFLLRSSLDGELSSPDELTAEDWLNPSPPAYATKMAPPRSTAEDASPRSMFYVYPVRQRRDKADDAIIVGRAPACDICVGDASLSKIHAAFEPRAERGLVLTDRGSTNGTFIGDERLEPGVAYDIPFGKTLRFGNVRLTYMEAPQFVDFLRATSQYSRSI